MTREELKLILENYEITNFKDYKVIDSTNNDDYRLNVIVDKAYVLRINDTKAITEERLSEIDRLATRYREIGILAPKLYKNKIGTFSTNLDNHICYISEYLDFETEDSIDDENIRQEIRKEVISSIGRFSAKFSEVDISKIYSMWSIINLSPLDTDIDEKQENLDMLTAELRNLGEVTLASDIDTFNRCVRERIKTVLNDLPRCVIQGDLNDTNLLVKNGHFAGLIDFNMSGTEVNINHFCCETNYEVEEDDFNTMTAEQIYEKMIRYQDELLQIIFNEYTMSPLEKKYLEDFRSICLISQYPNVMGYISLMHHNREKVIELLKLIISR